MINSQQILTTTNSLQKVALRSANMSSNYRKGDTKAAASLAIDKAANTYFHTKCGADEWWSAQFGARFQVTEVRIQNRSQGNKSDLRRLQKAEVTVEGQYCGSLPADTHKAGEWFTVKCERPLSGTNVMVRNTLKKCLHFTSIEVIGHKMDQNGSRGLNVVALDASNHNVLLAEAYDTYGNAKASGDLIKDLAGIRRGSIIIAAVKDEASK